MKTILSLDEFSLNEIKSFALALKSDRFHFVIEKPSAFVSPKDIHAFQLTDTYYAGMLDDPDGHFLCFLICFQGENEQQLRFPMGIFGVSPRNKIRFPILLSGRILNFLNIDEAVFVRYIFKNTPSEDDKNIKWQKFYQIKKHLIKRILMFYTQMDDDFVAAMVWKSRGKASLTRQIGETLPGYIRMEEPGADAEYYFKNTLDDQRIQYLIGCYARRDLFKGPDVAAQEIPEPLKLLLAAFITQLVTTQYSLS